MAEPGESLSKQPAITSRFKPTLRVPKQTSHFQAAGLLNDLRSHEEREDYGKKQFVINRGKMLPAGLSLRSSPRQTSLGALRGTVL